MEQNGRAGKNSETKHRILIVEDDTALAGGLCRALQNEAVETVSCHTLREASALLGETADAARDAQTSFSLVLLDINLPDGNGFDFLQEIKREYDMCVIMLTANDMETDIVAGLELGADDYITKPFSLAVLRARVETQLRRMQGHLPSAPDSVRNGQAADGNAAAGGTVNGGTAPGIWEKEQEIVIDDYSFHFPQMRFRHGEEQIELSKSEQKLLHILVENRGITLTREQLLDHIWSVDAEFVDENALSVTVKRLRDKLGAQERIRTVYGIGYRWE